MSESSKPVGERAVDASVAAAPRARAAQPDHTLLGVAPPIVLPPQPGQPAAVPAPAPTAHRPAASSAIAASRMISVSESAPVVHSAPQAPVRAPLPSVQAAAPRAAPWGPASPAAAPPALVSVPPQPLHQRPASLGGWQSAGPTIAYQAPSLIQTLTNVTSPLAEPLAAAEPELGWADPAAPDPIPPKPAPPLAAPVIAAASPAPDAWQPVMHTVPIPVARAAAAEPPPASPPTPETFGSTALSDDYLRAARDAARADPLPIMQRQSATPAARAASGVPAEEALANAATLQFESVAPVRAPLAEQPPVSILPISMQLDTSWDRSEGHTATQPLEPRSSSPALPSWRLLVLILVSVLAIIAIAAAAFVAVRRLSNDAGLPSNTGNSSLQPREVAGPPAAPAARPSADQPRLDAGAADARESAASARAAELVVLGRYRDAQPLYAQLARDYPGTPAYAALQRMLARTRGSSE